MQILSEEEFHKHFENQDWKWKWNLATLPLSSNQEELLDQQVKTYISYLKKAKKHIKKRRYDKVYG